jgi:hypothetical protein
MKKIYCIVIFCFITFIQSLKAQPRIDSLQFFTDTSVLDVTLTTDMTKLINQKSKNESQKATFACKLADRSTISEEININARGVFRRSYCFIPPLKLNFHNPTSPRLYPLNSLKLVCPCRNSTTYQQYLLKEFLVYKIYTLLTDKSFRSRLLRLTYNDSRGKKKPFTSYAFLVEDVDALAKRNHCKEWKNGKISTENTQRDQMTLVAVFQYMIGNTDWAIPNGHNIKLIYNKKDSVGKPYAVPYDFDYSGLVNTDYAVPAEELGTHSVTERVYRGFARTMNELQNVFNQFNKQKENIYALIKNFEPLSQQNKKEMIWYLDDFYKTINNRRQAELVFIDKARVQ